jgi:hypothetical protein
MYVYLVFLAILKGYTLYPRLLSKLSKEQKLSQHHKRSDQAAWLLVTITLFLLVFVVLQTLSGIISIIFGESFYEAFSYKSLPEEAYYEGIEKENTFSEFRFSLRVIIINFLTCKPLFGIGLLEKYFKHKNE